MVHRHPQFLYRFAIYCKLKVMFYLLDRLGHAVLNLWNHPLSSTTFRFAVMYHKFDVP